MALVSLARLSSTSLMHYKNSVADETEYVKLLSKDSFQSRNWTAAHLRLAEMQVSGKEKGDSKPATKKLLLPQWSLLRL